MNCTGHTDIAENQAVRAAKATYLKQSGLVPIPATAMQFWKSYPSKSISQSAIRGLCHLSQQTRRLQSIFIWHYKNKLSLPVIYGQHIFLLISVVHMEHNVTVRLQRSLYFLGYYIVGPLVSLGSTCSVSQAWSKILKVPLSSQRQNLNLQHTSTYLYSIYTVSVIYRWCNLHRSMRLGYT